jgi:hypothetical protein
VWTLSVGFLAGLVVGIEAVILPENWERLANEQTKFLVDGVSKLVNSAWRYAIE